jgi:hypothetical protein
LDRSEPPFDRLDEVVATGVPLERPAFDDLRTELGDDVVGIDFGTLSGRAVVVRVSDGAELASAVHEFGHGVVDRVLPATGERLPPERDMAEELGIAVGTLRKALAELQNRGLLERVQGSGNYVRAISDPKSVYAMFRLELLGGGGLPTAEIDIWRDEPVTVFLRMNAANVLQAFHAYGDGVLVLSEFAGAFDELKAAVAVNPHDIDDLKKQILRAKDMAPAERRHRMLSMRRRVREHDVEKWSRDFLTALAHTNRAR